MLDTASIESIHQVISGGSLLIKATIKAVVSVCYPTTNQAEYGYNPDATLRSLCQSALLLFVEHHQNTTCSFLSQVTRLHGGGMSPLGVVANALHDIRIAASLRMCLEHYIRIMDDDTRFFAFVKTAVAVDGIRDRVASTNQDTYTNHLPNFRWFFICRSTGCQRKYGRYHSLYYMVGK